VLEGRDTLVAMPAGFGKSAVYRVPALMLPGPTIVVSPANSGRRFPADVTADIEPLVHLSVAQLEGETLDLVRAARPSLFVVDEAQCLISGTENFLPAYRKLGTIIAALGRPLLVALTVTPSPAVRTEIVTCLGMRNTAIVVRGFDQPNALVKQAG